MKTVSFIIIAFWIIIFYILESVIIPPTEDVVLDNIQNIYMMILGAITYIAIDWNLKQTYDKITIK